MTGAAAAATFGVLHFGVAATPVAGGAALTIETPPTGEIAVSPASVVARGEDVRPGSSGAISGAVTITNQAAGPLSVVLEAVPKSGMLDDVLVLDVRSDGEPLLDGAVGGPRDRGLPPLTLAPGESATLDVRASLLPVSRGWQGVEENVRIEMRTSAAGS